MKKILVLILLIAISVGAFLFYRDFLKPKILKDYSKSSILRDQALNNLVINQIDANYGLAIDIVAKWETLIKTNPATSSVKMEFIATRTELAQDKKVIASSLMKGITIEGSDKGSLTCRINPDDMTAKRPYGWVRITLTIGGKTEPPIIKLLGKYNR